MALILGGEPGQARAGRRIQRTLGARRLASRLWLRSNYAGGAFHSVDMRETPLSVYEDDTLTALRGALYAHVRHLASGAASLFAWDAGLAAYSARRS
jgi:hypothetical protein